MRVRGLVLTLLAIMGTACSDRVESSYATLEQAVEAGAVGPGRWIPTFLPTSATDIREIHDLDTNEGWVRFRYPREDHAAMVARLQSVSRSEFGAASLGNPAVEWWDGEDIVALAEKAALYGSVERTGKDAGAEFTIRRMVLLLPDLGEGYVWMY